jgi:hypothetical protein
MMRILTLVGMVSLVGCTVMIIPHSTSKHGTSLVYLSIQQNDTTVAPAKASTAVASYVGLATQKQVLDNACAHLQPLIFAPVPMVALLTPKQRKDANTVESILVSNILDLRTYIGNMVNNVNQFYASYQQACKSVEPPLTK